MTATADLTELRRKHREQGRLLRDAERAHGITAGEKHRQLMAARSREASRENAEVGLPPLRNEELWQRYRFDLFAFLTERFPQTTGRKPFSADHRKIIARIQQTTLDGGQELVIWFRGAAKSTIVENTAIWAGGYGHRVFFVPIGADHDAAKQTLDSIQSEFEMSDLLMEIFPAVCHCARALEGVPQRAGKQTVNGELTHIEWTSERCVLPTIPGFEGSGAIIWPKGITANIRGLRFKRPDGTQARPDFVMGDELQTDESALSPAQNHKRLSKLNKTILRLGGHDKHMACIVLGTVIEPDDAIDQLSDPKLYPAWRVSKVPMLKSFPKAHDSHWLSTYAELRTTFSADNDEDKKRAAHEATQYYADNRAVMDEGGEASWEHCYVEGEELSAIQHAYNIMIDTTIDAFMAECQAQPVRDNTGLEILTPDEICRKQSEYPRDQFPAACTKLVAFIDSHPSILYWEAWAYEPLFTGYCINYGTFPDQRRKYFSHSHLTRRLQHFFPGRDTSATIDAAIDALLHGHKPEGWPGLMRHEWTRSDGVPMRLARVLADANGEESDAIKRVLRRSQFAALLTPSFGKGIGAKNKPMSQWQQSKGARVRNIGPEWVPTKPNPGQLPGIMFDTNYWKTRFHRALALPTGSQGALYLFKTKKPQDHRRIADHWYSEKPDKVTAGIRSAFEWKLKPGQENHDLDCAVGCMVGASYSGIASVATATKSKAKRKAKYL